MVLRSPHRSHSSNSRTVTTTSLPCSSRSRSISASPKLWPRSEHLRLIVLFLTFIRGKPCVSAYDECQTEVRETERLRLPRSPTRTERYETPQEHVKKES